MTKGKKKEEKNKKEEKRSEENPQLTDTILQTEKVWGVGGGVQTLRNMNVNLSIAV